MRPDAHQATIQILRKVLADAPAFIERRDPVYGTLFECQVSPCCVPLGLLAWVNPQNEGVFVRIVIPAAGASDRGRLLSALNDINVNLPVGSFVFTEAGEVRFKSAVFVGDSVPSIELVEHLLASAADMVRVEYSKIVHVLTGVAHKHAGA